MPRDFPRLKAGDVVQPWLFNVIFDELRRWRKLSGTGDVTVSGANTSTIPPVISITTAQASQCVAKITTEVAKATSTTRPGKGKLQRYTTIDMTTTPATLANLTGYDEDCVSINKDYKIAVNSTVNAIKVMGVWHIVAPDSCASLIA
jgi:hypothetical protein